MNIIENHLEKIMQYYSEGEENYDLLKKAKSDFFNFTGKIDDEADEFESRMSSFSDWFVFNYDETSLNEKKEEVSGDNSQSEDTSKAYQKVIDRYIFDYKIDEELAQSFYDINYSVFYFVKYNYKKEIVLKDILHGDKFIISKSEDNLGLVPDDMFVGRIVSYAGKNYVLRGKCTLPSSILSKIKKEAKKLKKTKATSLDEASFLLNLERLKAKSLNYSHVDVQKIFDFS